MFEMKCIPLPAMTTPELALAQSASGSPAQSLPLTIRHHPRASRIIIRISARTGVVVTAPPRASRRLIESAVHQRREWIVERLDELRRQENTESARLATGCVLQVLGRELTLQVDHMQGYPEGVVVESNTLVVNAPGMSGHAVGTLLRTWLRKVAEEAIPVRVQELNDIHRMEYSRVCVRDQKTRWGSCSKRGTLSFNWRVVLLPPTVMDYLIVHELAHLKEMNHSGRFWALVETMDPGFHASEQWLKRNGRRLPL